MISVVIILSIIIIIRSSSSSSSIIITIYQPGKMTVPQRGIRQGYESPPLVDHLLSSMVFSC